MAEGRNDRIDKLSQRFHRHTAGRPPATTPRRRERRSFYLDGELTQRLDTEPFSTWLPGLRRSQ